VVVYPTVRSPDSFAATVKRAVCERVRERTNRLEWKTAPSGLPVRTHRRALTHRNTHALTLLQWSNNNLLIGQRKSLRGEPHAQWTPYW